MPNIFISPDGALVLCLDQNIDHAAGKKKLLHFQLNKYHSIYHLFDKESPSNEILHQYYNYTKPFTGELNNQKQNIRWFSDVLADLDFTSNL